MMRQSAGGRKASHTRDGRDRSYDASVTDQRPSVVSPKSEEFWHEFFEQGGDTYRRMRWAFKSSRPSRDA